MPVERISLERDHVAGTKQAGTPAWWILAVNVVGQDGGDGTPLAAGTDRSGTAATTSGQIIPANAARRGLEIQNVGTNSIGINEFAGAAAIGSAGTYTLVPGASIRVRTNRAVHAIAATGATPFTATEW